MAWCDDCGLSACYERPGPARVACDQMKERRALQRTFCQIGDCNLADGHVGSHRGSCGCINGCQATDCPNGAGARDRSVIRLVAKQELKALSDPETTDLALRKSCLGRGECLDHERYQVKRKPRGSCEWCWALWLKKRGLVSLRGFA